MRSPEEIGKAVRQLRGGLSLRDFAQKCGISHTSIDTIEKGYDFRTKKPTQPKLATLSKIAEACGVPLAHITEEPSDILPNNQEDVVIVCRNGGQEIHKLTPEQLESIDILLGGYQEKNKKGE